MKNKILILYFLLAATLTGWGQIALDSSLSITTSPRVNIAATAAWVISGTVTYNVTVSKVKLRDKCTYSFYFTNGNTSTTTSLAFNGGTPIPFKKWSSGSLSDLSVGEITATQRLQFTYNSSGPYLILASGGGGGAAGVTSVSGTANQIASTGGATPVLS